MHILAEEFSRQASMESELDIRSSLAAPPKKDILSLSKAQLSFMGLFATPLFKGVADILPDMQYTVDELHRNQRLFEDLAAEEEDKSSSPERLVPADGTFSPRTMTFAVSREPPKDRDASTPSPMTIKNSDAKGPLPQVADTVDKPSHIPVLPAEYKEINGIITSFDSVADFARSDPFNVNSLKHQGSTKQRGSEATEGGSVPCSGDWASQATSATTGKMPLSPSTQGTSIISRDSLDRPTSVPVTTITAPESATTTAESVKSQADFPADTHFAATNAHEAVGTNGNGVVPVTPPEVEGDNIKSLKKKPSRFRINALPFFRRHKSPSPPVPTMDASG